MNEHPRVLSATKIIGNKVVNREGEQLGNIKDLTIDLDDAQIAYAVLSFGGFLGVGDKLFAIPLEALLFIDDQTVILDVEKEVLKNAPGFDKDHWPDDAHEAFFFLRMMTRHTIVEQIASRMMNAS
jgi:sporulation protein YlmC with PRC-barrel domain